MQPQPTRRGRPIAERLWSRVEKTDSCWLWRGPCYPNGYGMISRGGRGGKITGVHRIAWELTHGTIPGGMMVCHACDIRICVNPEHLFLGDHSANMRDMVAKGRGRKNFLRGQKIVTAKLKDSDIPKIRTLKAQGATYKSLAQMFGVSRWAIHSVLVGVNWKHVA